MKRLFLFLLLFSGSAFAQTAAITNPPSGTPTINADAGQVNYHLTSTCTSCGHIAAAAYYIDGSPSVPGSGELLGISRTAPWVYLWNPYATTSNGAHSAYVEYVDIENNVLATSAAVSFRVENNLPQQTCSTTCTDISVTTALVAPVTIPTSLNWFAATISFYGSGPTTLVAHGGNPYCQIADSPPGGAMSCGTTTAGNVMAVWFQWQSATTTLTCTASGGAAGTIAYGTLEASSQAGASSRWCYSYNIAGGGSSTITGTLSAGTIRNAYAFEITGPSSTPSLDVNATGSGNSPPMQSAAFNLTQTPAHELILAAVGWGGANHVATPTPGWTLAGQDANENSAVEYINPPGAIFGTEQLSVTVNGPNSGISKVFATFVDGLNIATSASTISATQIIPINTAGYLNEPHQVLTRADGVCSACTPKWYDMGAWENTQTFTNLVVPSQLTLSAREVFLAVSGSSQTVTATDQNTDGSTSAATITSCVIDSTPLGPYFTVANTNGNCVVTPTSTSGIDFITATDSNGLTRQFWVFNLNPGEVVIPDFNTSGQMQQGYTNASMWRASGFNVSCGPFFPMPAGQTGLNRAIAWGPGYANAGFTAVECSGELPGNSTQSAYEAQIASDIAGVTANLSMYGQGKLSYIHLLAVNWFRGTPEMYTALFGPASPGGSSGYSINAFGYMISQWLAAGSIGATMADEVGLAWAGQPLEGTNTGGIIIGTNFFSQLSGNGTTCTITWPSPYNSRFTGSSRFIITGSGKAALDYVASTNTPIFTLSGSNFPCTYSGSPITSGTLQLQTYVNNTFTTAGVGCPTTSASLPAGGGPCPQYIPYDAFKTIRSWLTNLGAWNFTPAAWNPQGGQGGGGVGGIGGFGVANWSGALGTAVAGVIAGDYTELYISTVGGNYLPSKSPMSLIISQIGDAMRSTWNYVNRASAMTPESNGIVNSMLLGPYPSGYQIAVASCAGNTITTSTPHLIYNIVPEFTQVTVNGSGSGLCDGDYYIIAAPTAYTLTVVLANPTFYLGSTSVGGTISFSNTVGGAAVNSYTLTTMESCQESASCTLNTAGQFETSLYGVCPSTVKNNRGLYFTVSGSSNANVNASTFWFDNGYTLNVCEASGVGGEQFMRQVPSLSASSGGTAYIVPDGHFHHGINWNTSSSDQGPRILMADLTENIIEGGSGHRMYSPENDTQYSDLTATGVGSAISGDASAVSTAFHSSSDQLIGFNPVVDIGGSQLVAQGVTFPNLFAERELKYLYQTRLNSPDYGEFFEAAARTGSYGNILLIQSFADNSTAQTVTLTPYLESGQPIIVYAMTWDSVQPIRVLSAGTTTDIHPWGPGEFRAYVFPVNEAVELNEPSISARLADVANATDIVVQYSYSPLSFTSPSVASQTLYQANDCGTGTCQLPVDKSIGVIYYRLIYRDAGGAVLATSALQTE